MGKRNIYFYVASPLFVLWQSRLVYRKHFRYEYNDWCLWWSTAGQEICSYRYSMSEVCDIFKVCIYCLFSGGDVKCFKRAVVFHGKQLCVVYWLKPTIYGSMDLIQKPLPLWNSWDHCIWAVTSKKLAQKLEGFGTICENEYFDRVSTNIFDVDIGCQRQCWTDFVEGRIINWRSCFFQVAFQRSVSNDHE